jgi:hypothetical protein
VITLQKKYTAEKKYKMQRGGEPKTAMMNFYTKISKYDLDRGQIPQGHVKAAKEAAKIENAKQKKLLQDAAVAQERVNQVL